MISKLISDFLPLPENVDQFSIDFIEHNKLIKLEEKNDSILIGSVEEALPPIILKTLSKTFRGKSIKHQLIDDDDLTSFISKELSQEEINEKDFGTLSQLDIDRIANDAPVINFVNSLLIDAVKQNASDVHIECFSDKACARFRIDSVLHTHSTFSRDRFRAVSSRLKIMSNLNILETRRPQDGRITVQLKGLSLDIRISIIPIIKGESLVLRILNTAKKNFLNLTELGFPDEAKDNFLNLMNSPHGMILVTGPTGSGKTTTLNTLLRSIDSQTRKVITIEDPVEFEMDDINQIQTNDEIDLNFSSILRRVLRQDPDVIMVGEIRDQETADLAVRASLTGHLVLSTLHTNDASSAISRLINLGVPSFLVSSVIRGVLAQRLVRKLCTHCRVKEKASIAETHLFNLEKDSYIYKQKGCPECNNTGYKGRMVVLEYFTNSKKLENLIASEPNFTMITEFIENELLFPFIESSKKLILQGITSFEEIKRVVFVNA